MKKEYDVIVAKTRIGGATVAREMVGKGNIRCTFLKVTIVPFLIFTRRESLRSG